MSDALQTCLAMQPYNEQTAALFFVSHGDDWLCHKHSLALPAIPPTTSKAHQYFLSKSMNMMLLLMLVAMKNQIMKHLLGSRTNQLIEKINIMSPLRSSLHMLKLGRNSTMSEPLKKLHQ